MISIQTGCYVVAYIARIGGRVSCKGRWSSFSSIGPMSSGPWALEGSREVRTSRISCSENSMLLRELLMVGRSATGGRTKVVDEKTE